MLNYLFNRIVFFTSTQFVQFREAQSKFMEEAVKKVEKYFGQVCSEMGGVSRKTARLRDKYDKLAKVCNLY